ncbi:MAG: hypothetical protein HY926_04095 [Elusimicrobia bacterium]|nr:hypothetical protein [Elusimicrobiota bacterium]
MTPGAAMLDRRGVEAAVAALQASLADGDPADAALRARSEAELERLRAAYRAAPAAFTKETLSALRELVELLRDAPGP